MTAEIVSVGTELLLGQIVDTNAAALGKMLAELGIGNIRRQTVGDNLERVTTAIRESLDRSDIVFTIGGLGPTEDDLTRDGISGALADPLTVDDFQAEKLRSFFAKNNLPWLESQIRQAMRPICGRPIDNPNGTAPGLICEKGGKIIIALPGPNSEFVPMVTGPVREFLREKSGGKVIHSRILRICGMGESIVEDRVKSLLGLENPTVAPLAHPGEVHLRITAKATSIAAAEVLIEPVEAKIREALGDAIFGTNETTLEKAVLDLLAERKKTLVVAESCTGGGLGARITNVSGSSSVFLGGIISYSNALKVALLGVSAQTLEHFGAVSEQCAKEMAEGARAKLGSDYAVSITGIAGPDGGTPDKPVGLVYIGIAGPKGTQVMETKHRGGRDQIRIRSIQSALVGLRKQILSG